MADDISGTALGLLAAYLCLGLGVLAVQLLLRARLRRGRPPARDLSPHEIAYLHGEERRTVAVSLAALRLDHAVDAFADGRLLAARPGPGRPRVAAAPLDEAVPRRSRATAPPSSTTSPPTPASRRRSTGSARTSARRAC